MSERSAFHRFTSELRRRHVPQTAAVYLVAAWAAIEFADVVVPNLNGPQWIVTAVIVAAGVGFPVVLVLSWIFDWGPEGLERSGSTTASPAPWVTALAVLVVGIASAVVVAALLPGMADSDRAVKGARGDVRDSPSAPGPPPRMLAPGDAHPESIQSRVLRDLEGFLDSEDLADLRSWSQHDSLDVGELVDLGRAMAAEAGLALLIQRPAQWGLGRSGRVALREGETLEIAGLARDSAGVRSVAVDGETVAESDPADETLRFRATLEAAGASGVRQVPIVVRTADGREIVREYEILQRPGGSP